ncbi:isochorismatase domain-containing protein [Physcia stellaris]|nr:isochorismatase domain-containing protein [Physcia stellaris]
MAEQQEVFGGGKNFWLYSKATGYDLTHPPTPKSPAIYPRIPLEATNACVAIDPAKTALVVVDLQNYFLSPAIGRPPDSMGMKAVDKLLHYAIPACRKVGIPVVWLNWGLSEQDIEEMPPTIVRGFAVDNNFNGHRNIEGLGSDVGSVRLDDGSIVEGGRVLMKDQWNSESFPPLAATHQPNDIHVDKNRLSGFWGGTAIEEALTARGIRTLLFAGVNTDQCVGGSLQDALAKGWDCILLSDGCATTSPQFAQQCIEFNSELGWGFLMSCEDLAKSINNMQTAPKTEGGLREDCAGL